MAHTMSAIDRDPRRYTIVKAENNQGQAITLTSIDVAMLPPNIEPTQDTDWISVPVAEQEFEVVLTGHSAVPEEGDLVVSSRGGDVYLKQTNGSYTKAVKVERINIER